MENPYASGTLSGRSTCGASSRHRRPSLGARPVRHQGEGARGHKTDAAQASGGQDLHGHIGVFYIGLGDQFDGDKVQTFPPGSVTVLPGDTFRFHWAKSGEYVTQVSAIGPLGL
ncbi:MAG: hypothetical protein JO110_21450 [Acetobacteraceae bacterium]|nr:hypothetical protein [Acetobacteraceae bacterium]